MINFRSLDKKKEKEVNPLIKHPVWVFLALGQLNILLMHYIIYFCNVSLAPTVYGVIGLIAILTIFFSFVLEYARDKLGWILLILAEVIFCFALLYLVFKIGTTTSSIIFNDLAYGHIEKVVWSKAELVEHSYIILNKLEMCPNMFESIQSQVIPKANNPEEVDRAILDLWKSEVHDRKLKEVNMIFDSRHKVRILMNCGIGLSGAGMIWLLLTVIFRRE